MNFKSTRFLPAVAAALLALAALPGCFTGVERTPVIKDTTGGNASGSKPTPEERLMADVIPQQPADWRVGKSFILTPGRLDYAYSPVAIASKLNPGDTLRFAAFRGATRLAGDSITELVLTTPSGEEIISRIEAPMSQVMTMQQINVPFSVDVDLVNGARAALSGKKVWSLRPDKEGKKFRAMEITEVLPGNADYPFIVIANGDSIRMVTNSRNATARTFANQFSLTNPRKNYPQISDTNWKLISQGRVALDMTREECRLALGAPSQVDREALPNGIFERWIYEDGVYLFFTDGLLTRFRQ
ncbi:MAG: hypothetical protein K2N10_01460 [Muribaculaceae bacterium]|nr:hypothetical protein [Muribaculaceae bacterium]